MVLCACSWEGNVRELILSDDEEDVILCLCPKCRAHLGYTYCDDLEHEEDFFTLE